MFGFCYNPMSGKSRLLIQLLLVWMEVETQFLFDVWMEWVELFHLEDLHLSWLLDSRERLFLSFLCESTGFSTLCDEMMRICKGEEIPGKSFLSSGLKFLCHLHCLSNFQVCLCSFSIYNPACERKNLFPLPRSRDPIGLWKFPQDIVIWETLAAVFPRDLVSRSCKDLCLSF